MSEIRTKPDAIRAIEEIVGTLTDEQKRKIDMVLDAIVLRTLKHVS